MQRKDIIYGLYRSLERGESLESAKKTFIDAGYPAGDVEDSARAINPESIVLSYPHAPLSDSHSLQIRTPTTNASATSSSLNTTPLIRDSRLVKPLQQNYPLLKENMYSTTVINRPSKGIGEKIIILLILILLILSFGVLILTIFSRETVTKILESLGLTDFF